MGEWESQEVKIRELCQKIQDLEKHIKKQRDEMHTLDFRATDQEVMRNKEREEHQNEKNRLKGCIGELVCTICHMRDKYGLPQKKSQYFVDEYNKANKAQYTKEVWSWKHG